MRGQGIYYWEVSSSKATPVEEKEKQASSASRRSHHNVPKVS
jgi:hypothetical protein